METIDDTSWRAATVTHATDRRLAEIRRRAIDPVLASVLTHDERAGMNPHTDLVVYRPDGTREISLWLKVRDEGSQFRLVDDGQDPPPDMTEVAARFASDLEDFVAESRFAWGQQRIARYVVPPA